MNEERIEKLLSELPPVQPRPEFVAALRQELLAAQAREARRRAALDRIENAQRAFEAATAAMERFAHVCKVAAGETGGENVGRDHSR